MLFRLPLLLSILLISGCAPGNDMADRAIEPRDVRLGVPFQMSLGETVRVFDEAGASYEGDLSFTRILEDSRCPAGTSCVWEGEVRVQLSLDAVDETQHTTEGVVVGMRQYGVAPEEAYRTSMWGYMVYFLRVDPYPGVAGDTTGVFQLVRLIR